MDKKEISTQPKPTWYNNYYFRSKLEAKWAVLFDHMKITWEYEPETFICDDNGWVFVSGFALHNAQFKR